jgi:hypothetical protein
MKYEFCFLKKDELEKKESEYKTGIELRKNINGLLLEFKKLGHKKVTKHIENLTREYLEKNHINYEYVYYQNLDKNYSGISEKYYDRTLIIKFQNYFGNIGNIDILRGYENNAKGGYYDKILEINSWYKKEEIEYLQNIHEPEFQNAYNNLEIYNNKLKELIELRNSFGFLAR